MLSELERGSTGSASHCQMSKFGHAARLIGLYCVEYMVLEGRSGDPNHFCKKP